jgi:hypothetical protein
VWEEGCRGRGGWMGRGGVEGDRRGEGRGGG